MNGTKKLSGWSGMFVGMALNEMNKQEEARQIWKDKILAEWENSKNYPRKKKKRVRKELRLDWSFACYDPFDPLGLF